jgi:hypothetical protein
MEMASEGSARSYTKIVSKRIGVLAKNNNEINMNKTSIKRSSSKINFGENKQFTMKDSNNSSRPSIEIISRNPSKIQFSANNIIQSNKDYGNDLLTNQDKKIKKLLMNIIFDLSPEKIK